MKKIHKSFFYSAVMKLKRIRIRIESLIMQRVKCIAEHWREVVFTFNIIHEMGQTAANPTVLIKHSIFRVVPLIIQGG